MKPPPGTPSANVISRALNRDFGIRTVPRNRIGYHASAGGVSVGIGTISEDNIATLELADAMRGRGWEIKTYEGEAVITVIKVPTKAEK